MTSASTKVGQSTKNPRISVRNVLVKGLVLFVLCNLIFALAAPLPALGRISIYNRLVPGRPRLPYGDDPSQSYNLTLSNLDAMFASHELAGKSKSADEYRVILIGDSSTWGYLLQNDETLAGALNAAGQVLPDGRQVRAYNLGYPVMSLTKDLLLLSYALRFEPDLIIWPMTLESFPKDKQLFPPLLQNNPALTADLFNSHGLQSAAGTMPAKPTGLMPGSIWGARRELADLLRLQMLGLPWAATGIDQDIPAEFVPLQSDLLPDSGFHGLKPPKLDPNDLALGVLQAGLNMAGDVPILFVNEPMSISQGENSDIRYNFYYPRWAYDDYRRLLAELSNTSGWRYLDLWDAVPPGEFTNTAVHMTPAGVRLTAERLLPAIAEIAQTIRP